MLCGVCFKWQCHLDCSCNDKLTPPAGIKVQFLTNVRVLYTLNRCQINMVRNSEPILTVVNIFCNKNMLNFPPNIVQIIFLKIYFDNFTDLFDLRNIYSYSYKRQKKCKQKTRFCTTIGRYFKTYTSRSSFVIFGWDTKKPVLVVVKLSNFTGKIITEFLNYTLLQI